MDRYDINSTVSWGAILAGGFTAAAVSLIVIAFGVGVGLSVVSPWIGEGISATTAGWSAGLFLVAVAMIASTFGGYITGRLRHAWEEVNIHERFFRDTAHGFVAWAFATVLTATLLAGAGTHLLAAAAAGAIPAAGAGAAQAANSIGDVYVDRLLRVGPQTDGRTAGPSSDQAATRAELLRIVGPATLKGSDVSAEDRTYAARLIAARTGIPQAEAEQRVNQTITQAKDAADKARSAAARFSIWIAVSLLAGAFSASLAAAEGGKLRNTRWYEEGVSTRTATVVRS
ncbi:MAG TPA: hypothetical protein VGQ63_06045 [Pseudolabrys sp.]|jgi:hypothetical protein|nr:hypothetical protein [Pseudolabrys sp.]